MGMHFVDDKGDVVVPTTDSEVATVTMSGNDLHKIFVVLKKAQIWARKSGCKQLLKEFTRLANLKLKAVLQATPAVQDPTETT